MALKISCPKNYTDYIRFRKLNEPIIPETISYFENSNIDTELFETDQQYRDDVSANYNEILERVHKKDPNFPVIYYWDNLIRDSFEKENNLSLNTILALKFQPFTVRFLENHYNLDISEDVEEFLKNFRNKYYNSTILNTMQTGSIKTIKSLLHTIEAKNADYYLMESVSLDDTEIINYLITHFKISQTDLNNPIFNACILGKLVAFEFLLNKITHDENFLYVCLKTASLRGLLSIIRLILNTKLISQDKIRKCLRRAESRGYDKVVKEFQKWLTEI